MLEALKKLTQQGLASMAHSKGGDSVIGIDVGTSAIKVVQLKKKGGKAILETYGALSLGPYAEAEVGQVTNIDEAKVATAITDLNREAGVTSDNAAISIPATASLIFMIELPTSIDNKQLAQIVPTEARKYIPVPINEVSLDWWVIPKQEYAETGEEEVRPADYVAKNKILVAAIHRDTIDRYKALSEKAVLQTKFFEIELFSSLRASLFHELGAVLLVDLGASKSKLAIIEAGVVRSFHVINRGGQDITHALSQSLSMPYKTAEESKRRVGLLGQGNDKTISDSIALQIDYVISETKNVILNYEQTSHRTLTKVILSGGGAMLAGILPYVTHGLGTPVELSNPFSKVEAPAFLTPVLEGAGPEFAIATGLALRLLSE